MLQSGKYEMVILLPDKMDGVKSLEQSFLSNSSNFLNLLAKMTLHKVVLDLPKFKIDSKMNLKNTLKRVRIQNIRLDTRV